MTTSSEGRIRAAVAERLQRWPDAADTAAGIARWWLTSGEAPPGTEAVTVVLDAMVADGVMRSWILPDGTKIYGANPGPDGRVGPDATGRRSR